MRDGLSAGSVGCGLRVAVSLICQPVIRGTWQAYSRTWLSWEELLAQVAGSWYSEDLVTLLLLFIGLSFKDKIGGCQESGGGGFLS